MQWAFAASLIGCAACCMQKPGQALQYGGSWVEHLNNAGISVAAHDMQSCGFSEGLGGRRSFFTAFENLVSDTLQFRRCHMLLQPAACNEPTAAKYCNGHDLIRSTRYSAG